MPEQYEAEVHYLKDTNKYVYTIGMKVPAISGFVDNNYTMVKINMAEDTKKILDSLSGCVKAGGWTRENCADGSHSIRNATAHMTRGDLKIAGCATHDWQKNERCQEDCNGRPVKDPARDYNYNWNIDGIVLNQAPKYAVAEPVAQTAPVSVPQAPKSGFPVDAGKIAKMSEEIMRNERTAVMQAMTPDSDNWEDTADIIAHRLNSRTFALFSDIQGALASWGITKPDVIPDVIPASQEQKRVDLPDVHNKVDVKDWLEKLEIPVSFVTEKLKENGHADAKDWMAKEGGEWVDFCLWIESEYNIQEEGDLPW